MQDLQRNTNNKTNNHKLLNHNNKNLKTTLLETVEVENGKKRREEKDTNKGEEEVQIAETILAIITITPATQPPILLPTQHKQLL